jgi:ribosomal protein S18 acetylase RimI-like enzyme
MNAEHLRIEELSLSAWPALQTRVYDGWILRFAEGYTKRSNSVNPLYASTLGLEEKIRVCEGIYAEQGLPAIFKILDCEEQEALDSALAAKGYARQAETSLRTMDLSRIEGVAGKGSEAELALRPAFDEAWVRAFCDCSGIEAERDIVRRMLPNIVTRKIAVSASIAGRIVGCGYGVLDRAYVGIFDIVVARDLRGRGIGERIMRAILEGSRALGAERAYLQVVVGNTPAVRLYDKLGFSEEYRYWYRMK